MTTNKRVYRLTHHGFDYIRGDDGTEYEVVVTYNQAMLDQMIRKAVRSLKKGSVDGALAVTLKQHKRAEA